jgi:6-pyruvoyltetrahydropterin/6-carboxytetrahydropterin synthase
MPEGRERKEKMTYLSTKTYGHELGLSAVFRQWRAKSHCNQLHGYSLSFKFTFEATHLDDRNWVVDFGGLAGLKAALKNTFDHKLVVAQDDPEFQVLLSLQEHGIADVVIVEAVGCEKFAELAAGLAIDELAHLGLSERVKVVEVECSEHGANSAIYKP